MKICPKCRGKYSDDTEICSDCRITLVDNKEYNKALQELNEMADEERHNHKFEQRYKVAYKYNYGYEESIPNFNIKTKEEKSNIPKCPTCGSTNIKPISTTKKVIGFATFGVFSNNFGKTMECKNCGYKF